MFNNGKIDKSSPVPLYYQLKQIILSFIDTKENGTALPTADEICNYYNISRTTVRTTLNELVNEDFILRKKGKGTVVKKTKKKLSDIYNRTTTMMMYAPMDFQIDEEKSKKLKTPKIALCVKSTEIEYFNKLLESVLNEFKKYNIKAVCFDSNSDIEKQKKDLKYLIENDFDLIIIDPCAPPKELNKLLNTAYENCIPVMAMNSHVDTDIPHLSYIGCDNEELGYRVGIYIGSIIRKESLPTPLDVAIIRGPKGNIAGKERETGFLNGIYSSFSKDDISIVNKYTGDWSEESGYIAVKDFIGHSPSIRIVFSYNDSMAIGGIRAAKELNREDIIFASIDGSRETLEALLNEDQIKVIGINDPDHIGRLTSEIALSFLISGSVPSKTILTEPIIVSAENIHSYYNSYNKRNK